jgi:hypothetical protein
MASKARTNGASSSRSALAPDLDSTDPRAAQRAEAARRADAAEVRQLAMAAGQGPGYTINDSELAVPVKKEEQKEDDNSDEFVQLPDDYDSAEEWDEDKPDEDVARALLGVRGGGSAQEKLVALQKAYVDLQQKSKSSSSLSVVKQLRQLANKINQLEQKDVKDAEKRMKAEIRKKEGKERKLTQGEKNQW